MSMNKPTCSVCRYYNDELSSCHRNPPQANVLLVPVRDLRGDGIAPQNFTTWPSVEKDGWCGEFAAETALYS